MAESAYAPCANAALPLAITADGLIIFSWLTGTIDALSALGAHVLASSALCGVAALLNRSVRPLHVLTFLMLLVLGPLGGAVLVCLALGHRLKVKVREARASGAADGFGGENQDRPSRARAVLAALRQGRRPVPSLTKPSRFVDIFESDDLVLQNAAIAAISRRYSPEMLPALMAALNAPIPAVRVQAAAVYAKLRNHYGERAKALLAATDVDSDLIEIAALAAECADVARSGFVDTVASADLRSRAKALAAREEHGPTDGHGRAEYETAKMSNTGLNPQPAIKRYSCGGVA